MFSTELVTCLLACCLPAGKPAGNLDLAACLFLGTIQRRMEYDNEVSSSEEGSGVVALNFDEEEQGIDFWSYCEDKEGWAHCLSCESKLSTKFKGSGGKVSRVKSHFNVDDSGKKLDHKPSKKRKICINNPFYTATPMMRQSSVKESFPPAVPQNVQREFNRKIARFFYLTGTAFYKANHQSLQEAVNFARPGLKVPDRHTIANSLLTEEYTYWKRLVDQEVADMGLLCLGSDGWSTLDNRAFLNYMAINNGVALMVDGRFSNEKKTARFLAEELHGIIQTIGEHKVCGVVTDNASANRLAWTILQKHYPKFHFYGCIAHTLHLFVRDVFKTSLFSGFEEKAKDIVKFFKSHQYEGFLLSVVQTEQDIETLKLPGATRWGSLYRCFESLVNNMAALLEIVNASTFVTGPKKVREQRLHIKNLIRDRDLFRNFEKLQAILKPVNKWLTHFQGDNSVISDAFHVFLDLKKEFADLVQTNVIDQEVCDQYLCLPLFNRWNKGYADIHGLAYLLDPLYQGEGMDEDNYNRTIALIDGQGLIQEFTHYKFKCNNSAKMMKLISERKISSKEWLFSLSAREYVKFPRLMEYIKRIFTCVPSSAACERNFSGFGYLNSKHRARLHKNKLRMLGFVYSNSRALKRNSFDPFKAELFDDSQEPEVIEEVPIVAVPPLDLNGFANLDLEYDPED